MNTDKEFDNLRHLLIHNRSTRRFIQEERIERTELVNIIELTRYVASGRNLQPLKYLPVCTEVECGAIFPLLAWAGYYQDWDGPEEGERPAAYIIQCLDTALTSNPMCDEGLHLEAITLGATALGYNCCIIKAFNGPALCELLSLPQNLKPTYIVALGKAKEHARLVPMEKNDIKYFRDAEGIHCVPKRPLDEIIIK